MMGIPDEPDDEDQARELAEERDDLRDELNRDIAISISRYNEGLYDLFRRI